ncbi:MAG: ribosome small subunit-dependent GTPase A [Clostridiales bacterium]|nr:ribosome small subunit-dependent GTPase A [Clostridiales bacterium]
MRGLVIKKQANLFRVELETGEVLDCLARKVLKSEGIFVGDYVFLDEDKTIAKIDKRKNILIRPPVANIDKMFIVIAPVPKPDFYTVDKMLLFCKLNNIEPILCINKVDIDTKICIQIEEIYKDVIDILSFSTLDESVFVMEDKIEGICVLAGQSAVGKSSIINGLKKENISKVDTFSKKTQRGKQTTRTVELYKFERGYLADTAGFSKLDESLLDLREEEIKSYYDEFLRPSAECKYKTCLHLNSKDCGVCKALSQKRISKVRYENYKKLYESIKQLKKF